MIFYIESNLTLLEGKLENAKDAKNWVNFVELICIVIYTSSGTEVATATFVTGKHLLTTAEFLFDNRYYERDVTWDKRVSSSRLSIGTSYSISLQVVQIYNPTKENKDDYRKEPAVLEVSYCVKGL